MSLPARYLPHYTLEDYVQWPGDWELWSGTAVALSPSPKKIHQRLSKRLVALLDEAIKVAGCKRCEALQEVDWRVSRDTVFRPDVFVVCDDPGEDYVEKAPSFIAEVLSKSTREKDLHFKRSAYESLGVKFYLTVDPEDSSLILLELVGEQYRRRELGPDQAELALTDDCSVMVGFDGIFEES